MNKALPLIILAVAGVSASISFAADKVVVIPLSSTQAADSGWIQINPAAAVFSQGASFAVQMGGVAGITLPDTNSPSFGLGFTIPPDFTQGTDLTIHMVWNIPATSCYVNLQPMALSVARPGRSHLTGPSVSSGLTIVGGGILPAPATVDQPMKTLATITSPEEGADLQAGDSVIFGFIRWPWHPEDTCDGVSMKIHGLSISYSNR